MFWIFTQIIEEILPLDFFNSFQGAMIDITIICKLLQKFLPTFFKKIKSINGEELIIRNIIMKLVLSLFTHIEKKEILETVWDCFFLEGCIGFFYVLIIFFKNASENQEVNKLLQEAMENNLDNPMNEAISGAIEKLCINYEDLQKLKVLLFTFDFGINSKLINYWRKLAHQSNEEKSESKPNVRRKNTYIQKEECDLDWPVCLYDRSYRFKKVEFIVYKNGKTIEFIDDYYFYGCLDDAKIRDFISQNNIQTDKETPIPLAKDEDEEVRELKEKIKKYEDLVIERYKHICGSKKTTKKIVFEKLLSIEDKKEKLKKGIIDSYKANMMINQFIKMTSDDNIRKTQNKEIVIDETLEKNIEQNILPEMITKTNSILENSN